MIRQGCLTRTSIGAATPLRFPFLFQIEAVRHQVFDTPASIPGIILLNQMPGGILTTGLDLDLIICREMAFTGNVSEQVRHITEIWLLNTDVAVKWNTAPRGHAVRVEAAYALADESGSSWFEGT